MVNERTIALNRPSGEETSLPCSWNVADIIESDVDPTSVHLGVSFDSTFSKTCNLAFVATLSCVEVHRIFVGAIADEVLKNSSDMARSTGIHQPDCLNISLNSICCVVERNRELVGEVCYRYNSGDSMRMVMSVRIPFTRLVTTLTRFLAFALLLVPGILLRELLVTVRRVVVVLAAVDARRTRTGLRFGNLVRLTNRRSTQRVLELQLGLYLVQLQLGLGCSVENGGDGRSIGLRHLREEPVNLDVVSEGVGAGRSQLFHKTNESLDLVDD